MPLKITVDISLVVNQMRKSVFEAFELLAVISLKSEGRILRTRVLKDEAPRSEKIFLTRMMSPRLSLTLTSRSQDRCS